MTSLDITYEDGLRLSELYGQLAGLKYEAANLFSVHIWSLVGGFILVLILAFLLSMLLLSAIEPHYDTEFRDEAAARKYEDRMWKYVVVKPAEKVIKTETYFSLGSLKEREVERTTYLEVKWKMKPLAIIFVAWPYVIPFLVSVLLYISTSAGIEMGIENTQAQIDAILAKYEGGF